MNYGAVLKKYIQAGNPSCSPELLKALARHKVDRIRLRVAENPVTPRDVLGILATDKNADVRIAVAINPSTPSCIRKSLALDQDLNVRFGIAEDMSCPAQLLDMLIEDAHPYISCRAQQTKQLIRAESESNNSSCYRLFRWARDDGDRSEFRYA